MINITFECACGLATVKSCRAITLQDGDYEIEDQAQEGINLQKAPHGCPFVMLGGASWHPDING